MIALALSLILQTIPSHASELLLLASGNIVCGGNYRGEELKFEVVPTLVPTIEIIKAMTANEEFFVFVEFPLSPEKKGKQARVTFGEVVKDSEWEKMKALRDASEDKELKEIISRVGSTRGVSVWLGWVPSQTGDYIHFEGTQRDVKYTFSCAKN